jgi:hypothetical protein
MNAQTESVLYQVLNWSTYGSIGMAWHICPLREAYGGVKSCYINFTQASDFVNTERCQRTNTDL